MKCFLGIDGGGTKTTAYVSDENGNIIARTVGKSINYYSNPLDTVKSNLKEIIDNLGIYDYACAAIGLSALSEKAEDKQASEFAESIFSAEKIILDSDIAVAIKAADSKGATALLIGGTGSMAAGIDNEGNSFHSGGWGYLLGDEGSAYAIALSCIKKILRRIDSGDTDDVIIPLFKSYFNVNTTNDILEKFYNPPLERSKIASFCEKIFEGMRSGSKIAESAIRSEAFNIAELSSELLRKLPENTPLFLYGGVFEHNPEYIELLNENLKKAGSETTAKLLSVPPAVGALKYALEAYGITLTDSVLNNLTIVKE